MTERNVRMLVEYDGTHFHGWQVQTDLRTVQGALEAALRTVLREEVRVRGSGRTDAGVHSWGQIASFRTQSEVPLHRIRRGVNALAGDGVRVVEIDEAPAEFDPLGSACGKIYAYRLLLRRAPSPLLENRAWWVRQPVDVDRLERELATLPATADWNAYRAKDCTAPSSIKTLRSATVRREEHDCISLVFEGSGFLKQMVRILVGTALEVGRGRMPEGAMVAVREGLDRDKAGPTAPPHGLYMERVLYPNVP